MKKWMTGLCLLLLSAAMAADSSQLHFTVPDGWKRIEQNNATLLVPQDVPAGKTAVLMIMAPQELQADFADWFRQQWGSFQANARLVEGGDLRTRPAGGSAPEILYTAGRLQDKNGKVSNVFFFAAKSGNSVHPFVFMSDTEGIPEAHQQALALFLENLTFAAGPAQQQQYGGSDLVSPSFTWGDVPPAKGNGGLSGLYVTENLVMESQQSVVSGFRNSEPVHHYWVFLPDGRCYYGLPDEGLLNFNYDYLRKMNALYCATYTLQGNQGTIKWGNSTETFSFSREGNKLVLKGGAGGTYVPVDPCTGLKLNGTYRRSDYQGQDSPKEGITFAPDGHFEDQGLLKAVAALWWFADQGYVSDTGAPGRGTYRIANNTLELIYTDGRKKRINFYLDPRSSRDHPDKFIVNTWVFVRVG